MQKVITLSTIFLTIFLASCATTTSYKPSFLREYIIDVPQGNVLEQDKISQLHSGQHKDQVKFLIGSPMLNDVFHKNRWDYVFQYRHGKTGVSADQHNALKAEIHHACSLGNYLSDRGV